MKAALQKYFKSGFYIIKGVKKTCLQIITMCVLTLHSNNINFR